MSEIVVVDVDRGSEATNCDDFVHVRGVEKFRHSFLLL